MSARGSTPRPPASKRPRTPIPELDPAAVAVTASVIRIYDAFLRQPNLSPSPGVNAIFSELVSLCVRPYSSSTVSDILSDPHIREIAAKLRKTCSTGEYLLENHWAAQILASSNAAKPLRPAHAALRAFPYFQNYMELARLELQAISSVHPHRIASVAFIGSGPLPLTSLCFSALLSPPPERLHNIDNSARAIAASSQLCAKLARTASGAGAMAAGRLTFQLADAAAVQDLGSFEVVFLAGLVGDTEAEKRKILANVAGRCAAGSLLVLRSAHGLRKLLYQEIDVGALQGFGLEVLLVVHPWNRVVNSVVVCRVVGTGVRGKL
ncbi:Nicotianamine synthase [Sphaerosporella brunnea]|uniref:Nicotianamine synthase n=1 Tax=Sphaerosporella brunnea TaxID=1250544 RepID=A0A5J5EEX4_9PEZI|nr:Nicotianamine synthase [Sphaerosporella brunnea]